MFCPNCGFKLELSNKFCPECGNSIPSTETENKIEKKEIPEQTAQKKNKQKPMLAVVLTIVLVAGLVGGGLLLFGDKLFHNNYEDILTTGYWIFGDEDNALLFRAVDNNDTFDGIAIINGEDIGPYIMDEDGTVTFFGYSRQLNQSTGGYDWEYFPTVIITIEENEDGSNYLLIKYDNIVDYGTNVDYGDDNDLVIAFCFSEWANYDYKVTSVDEYDDHRYPRRLAKEHGFDFRTFIFGDYYGEDKNIMTMYTYEYEDDRVEDVASKYKQEFCSIDFEENCVYIEGDRLDFNDDLTQLRFADDGTILYRTTDFILGKIADTDFPHGEFVERY